MATLQRLGEDVETSLKQLLFGTVRRSLRMQITEEMSRYGYLGPYEWKILDRISLIEVCKLVLTCLSYLTIISGKVSNTTHIIPFGV